MARDGPIEIARLEGDADPASKRGGISQKLDFGEALVSIQSECSAGAKGAAIGAACEVEVDGIFVASCPSSTEFEIVVSPKGETGIAVFLEDDVGLAEASIGARDPHGTASVARAL